MLGKPGTHGPATPDLDADVDKEDDMKFHPRPAVRKDFGSAFGVEGYGHYPRTAPMDLEMKMNNRGGGGDRSRGGVGMGRDESDVNVNGNGTGFVEDIRTSLDRPLMREQDGAGGYEYGSGYEEGYGNEREHEMSGHDSSNSTRYDSPNPTRYDSPTRDVRYTQPQYQPQSISQQQIPMSTGSQRPEYHAY